MSSVAVHQDANKDLKSPEESNNTYSDSEQGSMNVEPSIVKQPTTQLLKPSNDSLVSCEAPSNFEACFGGKGEEEAGVFDMEDGEEMSQEDKELFGLK